MSTRIKLRGNKDCINCAKAEVYGDRQSPNIKCMSPDSLNYNLFEQDGRYCASYCKGYREVVDGTMRQGNVNLNNALKFILAGKSELVLHSTKTNQDFTYKITRKESNNDKDKLIYFIRVKLGAYWKYAGLMWYDDKEQLYKYAKGNTGELDSSDINIKSLLFVINKLHRGQIPMYLEVFHVGLCGRCGKKLTTPESILTGLGPECSKKVGIHRVKLTNNI